MAEQPPTDTSRERSRNASDIREMDSSHETDAIDEKRGGPRGSDRGYDVGALSYEEARSRLVEIVARLEQGAIPLEESLRLWELGEQLARHCQAWLDGARQRLNAASAPDPQPEDDETSRSGAAHVDDTFRVDGASHPDSASEASDPTANSSDAGSLTPDAATTNPTGRPNATQAGRKNEGKKNASPTGKEKP
ncbi:MAG: exodeoxyribonuclease VII small subunit [Actinomycetaceae bacterium]|nr:exodeoxyribonuclease VII small subunit [Actinomycetaceae bacterium]